MSESLIGVPILATGFIAALILGAVANKTHFCTMGGVSDWINLGDKGRLGAWFLAMAVAIAGVSVLEILYVADMSESRPPYRSSNFAWLRYLLGGLMFGVGMTLASGCTTKTLIRLGGGNIKSIIVLLVVGICAYLMTKTNFYGIVFHSWMQPLSIDLAQHELTSQDLGSIVAGLFNIDNAAYLRTIIGGILILAILGFVLDTAGIKNNGSNWLAGIVVGLCITAGWYITGGPLGSKNG